MNITVNKNLNFKGYALCEYSYGKKVSGKLNISDKLEKKFNAKDIPSQKIEISPFYEVLIAGKEDCTSFNLLGFNSPPLAA